MLIQNFSQITRYNFQIEVQNEKFSLQKVINTESQC